MTATIPNHLLQDYCQKWWVFAAEPDLKKNSGWKITYYERRLMAPQPPLNASRSDFAGLDGSEVGKVFTRAGIAEEALWATPKKVVKPIAGGANPPPAPIPPPERPLSELFASIKAGMRRNRRNWAASKARKPYAD